MPKIQTEKNEQAAIEQWIDGLFCFIDHLKLQVNVAVMAGAADFDTMKAYTVVVVDPVHLKGALAMERNRKALEQWSKTILAAELRDLKLDVDFVIKPVSRLGRWASFCAAWGRIVARATLYKITGYNSHYAGWVGQLKKFFADPINFHAVAREYSGDAQMIDDYKAKYVQFVKL